MEGIHSQRLNGLKTLSTSRAKCLSVLSALCLLPVETVWAECSTSQADTARVKGALLFEAEVEGLEGFAEGFGEGGFLLLGQCARLPVHPLRGIQQIWRCQYLPANHRYRRRDNGKHSIRAGSPGRTHMCERVRGGMGGCLCDVSEGYLAARADACMPAGRQTRLQAQTRLQFMLDLPAKLQREAAVDAV